MVNKIFSILSTSEQKKFRWLVLLDILVSILDVGFLILLLIVVNFYTKPGTDDRILSLAGNLFKHYPLLLIIGYFTLFIIKNAFALFVTRRQYTFVFAVASRCSRDKLSSFLNGSYIDYVNIDSSVTMRSINQQPVEFAHYVLRGLQQVISQSALIFLTIVAILIYNAFLFALLLLILLPPIFFIGWIIKKKMARNRRTSRLTGETSQQHLNEALDGYIESNIYEKHDFFSRRYYSEQVRHNKFLAEQQLIQNLPSRFMEVFAMFGLMMLVCIHYYSSTGGTIDIIIIGAFIAGAYKIIPGVVKILNGLGQMKTYEFTVNDLMISNRRGGACLRPGGYPANASRAEASPAPTVRNVQIQNISFSYGNKQVIKNISAEFNSGDLVLLSGNSGSGKTTLVNILIGMLKADTGSILINNVQHDDALRSAWNRIAYSKQQSFFIHDTIRRNITFSEDVIDAEKFNEVLNITSCAIFDKKENYLVTENGKNISGGQRQRILFARALNKDHDMLILDEPFNELDEASELVFLKYLRAHADSGKIVLLITHNLSAKKFCNKIISLNE